MIFTKQNEWFCKLDVRKYFDSISHEILLQKLNDKFKDKALLQLFGQIINSYEVKPSIGLPIGNLTSQYFANFYLSFADHYIKEQLNVKAYMRYMDDMVLWGNNKQQLLQVMQRFIYYLKNHLGLEVKEPCIHKTKQGLPFLGFVMYPFGIRLNKRSKQRLFSKFNQYCIKNEHNEWSQKEYANHILPLIAFVQYANTKGLCDKLLVKWKYAYGLEPCESRRQLEQQSRVLSCCQSEQQHPRQPQQQYRVSPLPCPLAQ
jgi:retron-type reverse transcriptase